MKLSSFALAACLAAGPAAAQQPAPCMPHEVAVKALGEHYHEATVARMLASSGIVIEILAAADGSSFTILGVAPGGAACVLAAGSAFELVTLPAPGADS